MNVLVENITEVALSLPLDDRATLATRLLESLEPVNEDPNIREQWVKEAHRRLEEIETGAVEPIDGETVFAEVRDALRG